MIYRSTQRGQIFYSFMDGILVKWQHEPTLRMFLQSRGDIRAPRENSIVNRGEMRFSSVTPFLGRLKILPPRPRLAPFCERDSEWVKGFMSEGVRRTRNQD
jgi:hypothetical protein